MSEKSELEQGVQRPEAWALEQTRYWTDDDGQEWVCVPMTLDWDTPDLLHRVAIEWEAQNERDDADFNDRHPGEGGFERTGN